MFTRTESFRRIYSLLSDCFYYYCHPYCFYISLLSLPFFQTIGFYETFSGVNLYTYGRRAIGGLLLQPLCIAGFSHMLFNSFSLVLFGPST